VASILALGLVVGLGGWLRLAHLDSKVYWHDETQTSLRVFGYRLGDFVHDTFTGELLTVDQIRTYQRAQPDQGLPRALEMIAQRPEHGPLYYVLAYFSGRAFDLPQVGVRAASALMSLLLMPLMYLLAWELFRDRAAAAIAAALAALSPIHLLYAQEAREYALWAVTTVGASAALLRAMRVRTRGAWRVYALSAVVGLYSHLLFLAVAAAHGLYIVVSAEDRQRFLRPYARALAVSVLLFSPWLYLLATHAKKVHEVTAWMRQDLGLGGLLEAWAQHLGHLFFDLPWGKDWWVLSVLVLAAAGLALSYGPQKRARRFLFALIGVGAATVMLPDLLGGGRRSAEARYLMPVWVGLELVAAYGLGQAVASSSRAVRALGAGTVTGLLLAGLVSLLAISGSDTSWSKGVSAFNPEFARIINQAERPLVVSTNGDINPGEILSLSYLLDPKVRLILTDYGRFPDIPPGYTDVFLVNPSRELQEALAANYRLEVLHNSGRLWKLYYPAAPGTDSGPPIQAGSGRPAAGVPCPSPG
jgi:uncharacterized membrane protein